MPDDIEDGSSAVAQEVDPIAAAAQTSINLSQSGAIDREKEKRAAEMAYRLGITMEMARKYTAKEITGTRPDAYKLTPRVKAFLTDPANAAISIDDYKAMQAMEQKTALAQIYPTQDSRYLETGLRALGTIGDKAVSNIVNTVDTGTEATESVFDWMTIGQLRKWVFGQDSAWAYAPSDLSNDLSALVYGRTQDEMLDTAGRYWVNRKNETERLLMEPVADWKTTVPFTSWEYRPADVASGVTQLVSDIPVMMALGPFAGTYAMRAPDYERIGKDSGLEGQELRAYTGIRASIDGVLNQLFKGVLDGSFDRFAKVTTEELTKYIAKQYTTEMAKEQVEEQLSNLFGNVTDQMMLPQNKNKPVLEAMNAAFLQTQDEAITTALTVMVGQGGLAGGHAVGEYATMRVQADVTVKKRAMAQAIAEDIHKTKVISQSPATAIKLAQSMMRGASTMVMSTEKAAQLANANEAVAKGLQDAGIDLNTLQDQADKHEEVLVDVAPVMVHMQPETFKEFQNTALAALPQVDLINNTIDAVAEGREPPVRVERTPEELSARKDVTRIMREMRSAGRPHEEAAAVGKLLSAHLDFAIANGANPKEVFAGLSIDRTTPERFAGQVRSLMQISQTSEGPMTLDQRNDQQARGMIDLTEERQLIGVFDNSDSSTVVHELGHVFYENLKRFATSDAALPQTKTDWENIKKWTGRFDDDATLSVDFITYMQERFGGKGFYSLTDVEREQARAIAKHEYFARGFEAWLMEGKMPDPELAGVFARFARWLQTVYTSALRLNVTLTDDVREAFARMFMSDQDAADLEEMSGISSFDAEYLRELKVSEKDIDRMLKLLETAKARHFLELHGERSRYAKANRRNWRIEARNEIDAQPVYQLIKELRSTVPLDYDSVVGILGKKGAAELRGEHSGVIGKTEDQGRDPSAVAIEAGYNSAAEMLTELREAPTRQQAVGQRFQEKVIAGDTSYGALDALLQSDEYQAFIDEVGLYISKLETGKGRTSKTAEIRAQEEFNNATTREGLSGNRYLSQARSAFIAERNAVKKGDYATAFVKNSIARGAIEKARLASELRDYTRNAITKAKRAIKAKPGVIDQQHLAYMVIMGKKFGVLSDKVKDPDPEWLTVNDNEEIGGITNDASELVPQWMSDAQAVNYAELSAQQWREAADVIDRLDSVGRMLIRRNKQFLQMDMDAAAQDLIAEAEKRKAAKHKARDRNNAVREYFSAIAKFRYDLINIDGGINIGKKARVGTWESMIFNSIAKADQQYWRLFRKTDSQIAEHLKVLATWAATKPHAIDNIGVQYPEAITKSEHRSTQWNAEEILAIALNSGNADNIARIKDGLGLEDSDIDAIRAYLPSDVWSSIQGVWDGIESLWRPMSDQMMAMYGYRPRKIRAMSQTFTASDGNTVSLKGGYYPMQYDPAERARGKELEKAEDLKQQGMSAFLSPIKGFAMSRTDKPTGRLPRLDLSVINNHVQWVCTFATKGKVVQDVNRIMKKRDVAQVYADKLGDDAYNRVEPWLMAQLNLDKQELNIVDRAVGRSIGLGAAYIMGANPNTAINSGLGGAWELIGEVGLIKYVSGAVKTFMSFVHDPAAYMAVLGQSQLMSDRLHNRLTETEKFASQFDNGLLKKTSEIQNSLVSFSLIAVSGLGAIAEMPVWFDIYTKTLAKNGGDQEAASLEADLFIRKVAPTTNKADLAALQRSRKAMDRLIYPINGYINVTYNVWRSTIRAVREGGMTMPQAMEYLFMRSVVATNIVQAIGLVALIMSSEDDDEERAKAKMRQMMTNTMQFPTQGMPVVSNVVRFGLIGSIEDKYYAPSHPYAKPIKHAYQLYEDAIKVGTGRMDWNEDEEVDRLLLHTARMGAYMTGINAENMYKYMKAEDKKRK